MNNQPNNYIQQTNRRPEKSGETPTRTVPKVLEF